MKNYLFADFLMPISLSEFLKLPMIRQASFVTFRTIQLRIFFRRQVISTEELLDFLKDGPEGKKLTLTEHFLEDKHEHLLAKLLKVSLSGRIPHTSSF